MYTMRFDLRVPGMTPAQIASQYETAIEMAEWAEGKGCAAVHGRLRSSDESSSYSYYVGC